MSVLLHIGVVNAKDNPKLRVVATASMISDMVSEIAGDHIELECLVPIGGDPHIYYATPKDAQLIAKADLLFKNGLTFEGWLNELIENSGSDAKVITVTNGVKPIESLVYKNAVDPHAWMDVTNGLIYIENIKNALIDLDEKNAEIYQANYARYQKVLIGMDQYISEKIATIPRKKRILITSHDAFQYYGRRYDITLESILGISTDADVQTTDIMRIHSVIKEHEVPALFIESTINPKILEQLASDNNIRIGGKLYADSIGDKDSPASSYVNMLKHNTDVIAAALNQEKVVISQEQNKGSNTWWLYGLLAILLIASFTILVRKFN